MHLDADAGTFWIFEVDITKTFQNSVFKSSSQIIRQICLEARQPTNTLTYLIHLLKNGDAEAQMVLLGDAEESLKHLTDIWKNLNILYENNVFSGETVHLQATRTWELVRLSEVIRKASTVEHKLAELNQVQVTTNFDDIAHDIFLDESFLLAAITNCLFFALKQARRGSTILVRATTNATYNGGNTKSCRTVIHIQTPCESNSVDPVVVGALRHVSLQLWYFQTAEKMEKTESFTGSEIRLAIARGFCELYGGSLELEAVGCDEVVFTLTFVSGCALSTTLKACHVSTEPRLAESLESVPAATPKSLSRSILYVEDDLLMQKVVKTFIKTYSDYDVVIATTGAQAFQLIHGDSEFHAIILDNHLPGGQNGSEICLQLRQDHGIKCMIIAFSADDRAEADFLQNGANEFLLKGCVTAKHRLLEILEAKIESAELALNKR
ncbi:hypothetical protein CYMTET_37627 [Cymbomonas tetramitiformis]|uniref:Response regulatory domain-containing protein n=1 Tax=Cymbomonas tetramitiformis TaxID=36881 RepID=A0AAE0CDP0_9CHLO|nr:hypothetical protein CYMTET_37627 [Cymbomonas tetramitiformis]